MNPENTPNELTADLFQLHKDIRHAIQEIDTVDFEKRSEIIEKCFLISKEYTSLKLQEANQEIKELKEWHCEEQERADKLRMGNESLQSQLKSKDEMLEKMAECKLVVYDGINNDFTECNDIKEAHKIIKEIVYDESDGIHPDAESVTLFIEIGKVQVEDHEEAEFYKLIMPELLTQYKQGK